MAGQGTALLDFGAFPGVTDATVSVADAGITGSSLAEAWIFPTTTVDHSADEHWVDPPEVYAGSVVNGVGFTIYGVAKKRVDIAPLNRNIDQPRLYGKWTVGYVWN